MILSLLSPALEMHHFTVLIIQYTISRHILDIRAGPSAPVTIDIGYEDASMGKVNVKIGGIGHSDKYDPLETSGLGDCICLVAYDRKKQVGSMYHFVTTPCRSGPAEAIKIDGKPLKAAKSKLDKAFYSVHSKGAKVTNYYVKLGKEWTANSMLNDAPNKELTAACKKIFAVAPKLSGTKANFHPGTGKLT
ncbi:MAG: hypothetical protein AB3N11_07570 [Arenibacterium sp.]